MSKNEDSVNHDFSRAFELEGIFSEQSAFILGVIACDEMPGSGRTACEERTGGLRG